MTNAYQTPKANLEIEPQAVEGYGSIEKAISGDYELSIGDVIKEAWSKTKGTKWTFQVAFLLYMLVAILLMVLLQIASLTILPNTTDPSVMQSWSLIEQVLLNLILTPIMMGLFLLGVRRSVNAPLEAISIFDYFHKSLTLFATLILVYIMIFIGLLLLVIPGIYLMVAYFMALPLVVEKGLSPWRAMEVSRKAVTRRWFTVLFLSIVLTFIIAISMIPLGIGLIWTMPMVMIAYGVLYRNMFGVEAKTIS